MLDPELSRSAKREMNILDWSYFKNSLALNHDLEIRPFPVLRPYRSPQIISKP